MQFGVGNAPDRPAELVIDHTQAILDLSYEGLSIVSAPRETGSYVRALLLSGNPLQELDFARRFDALELIQLDGTGLRDFYELSVHGFSNLKHLLVRVNSLRDFRYLTSNQTLQSLDISQNCFDFNAEETLDAKFPSLRSVQFGFCTAQLRPEERQKWCSLSETRLNSVRLFDKLFVGQLQHVTAVTAEAEASVEFADGYKFKLYIVGNQLLIETWKEGKAKNHSIRLRVYAFHTGFQIKLLQTLEQRLRDFSPELEFNLHALFDGSDVVITYPTDQTLQNLDAKAVSLVQERAREQLRAGQELPSFWVLQLTMTGQESRFFIDPRELAFCDESEINKQIQLEIEAQKGISFGVKYASAAQQKLKDVTRQPLGRPTTDSEQPSTQLSVLYDSQAGEHPKKQSAMLQSGSIRLVKRNASSLQRPLVVGKPTILSTPVPYHFAHFYISTKLHVDLVAEIRDVVATLSDIEISAQTASRLLREAINEPVERFTNNVALVAVSYAGQKTPLRIQFEKKFVGDPENEFSIPEEAHGRFLAVQVFFKEDIVNVLDGPIFTEPTSFRVSLGNEGELHCTVQRTLADGRLRECNPREFLYSFALDGTPIQHDAHNTCPLQGKGMYTVQVTWAVDSTVIGGQQLVII